MPGPRLLAVVGKKNAGKTTLVVALLRELARRRHRVMSIKHGTHPFEFDERGRDTWRHMEEGGAERVVMETPLSRVVIAKTMGTGERTPRELAAEFLGDADYVVVEGFKSSDLPKVEVYRRAVHPAPLYDLAAPDAKTFVAIVTDAKDYRAPIPVLRFGDTNWLYRLADLVIEHAT